ncbi:MAG TPA: roadblock/LC7 domain-containing protein [Blastocatellia bacterium]|nr:roadblock/LC7 domain-containing protein [Blastocatellia bacterium]
MPFRDQLETLVSTVRGVQGAIVLALDGEAVEWCGQSNGERLKLRAAYAGVVLQAARQLARQLNSGTPRQLILSYDGARLFVQELTAGYFLILELDPSSNVGEAGHGIGPAIAILSQEIVG